MTAEQSTIDPPLDPPSDDLTLATPRHFDALTSESFQPIPGFDGMVRRELSHVGELTGNRFGALVMRANPNGTPKVEQWHAHNAEFQYVYVTKGWADFEWEGVGKVRWTEGMSIVLPQGCRHRPLDWSPDFEYVWLTLPSTFPTTMYAFDDETQTWTTAEYVGAG